MHEETKDSSNTILQDAVQAFFAGDTKVDVVVAAALEPSAPHPATQIVSCNVDTPEAWARLMKLHSEALGAALWCRLLVVGV